MSDDDLSHRIDGALINALSNASNYPLGSQMLGKDATWLREACADAMLPLIRQAQAQAWDEGWWTRATYDPSDYDEPREANPYQEDR